MPKLDLENPIRNVDLDVLQKAIADSRGPLILTDNQLPDNPITYANQAFLDQTGYTLAEIIGKNCRFLQGNDSEPKVIMALRQAVTNGDSIRITIKNYRKDGQAFWNDLVITPVINDGVTTHFIGTQMDITERVLAETKLRAKSDALLRANHEMEQFTYATSHDLQEPLRMISSYLQLINKRYTADLPEDARTFIGFATEGAERMQALISDLLALSRVSNSTDRFKPTPMAETVERALFNLRMSVTETNAEIIYDDLPSLSVDPVQMTQLFQNLIGNALKYRRGDRPHVVVSADKQADKYVFSVADNGIGIATQHRQRIFAVFQRLHTRAEYEGTGIGLAICCKIVERHGGKIWVEPNQKVGSIFKFSLPTTIRKLEKSTRMRTASTAKHKAATI